MEISQLEFTIAWASIVGTTLVTLFGGAAFLCREMRRGFDRLGRKLDRLAEQLGDLQISLTRIESHLRSNPPWPAGQQRS